ncbi:hypothetical protein SUGI_1125260 [Cryptomeria japonica]|nr:hypothetical protein SUGI_1125260 [Cryptomeria japonica]
MNAYFEALFDGARKGRSKEIPSVLKFLYDEEILKLQSKGLITAEDRDAIPKGLAEIQRNTESGKFTWRADREDVHMNIEPTLTDLIGEPAKIPFENLNHLPCSCILTQGLITAEDRDAILKGLAEVQRNIESGKFTWRADREDVHMNVEAALTDLIGEPAKKLHTARCRNDQVCTDVRLWYQDAIDQILGCINHLQFNYLNIHLSGPVTSHYARMPST